MHKLLGKGCSLVPKRSAMTRTFWKTCNFVFIDEGSVLGTRMLSNFHRITCWAKEVSSEVPFGGLHIIFAGEFLQFPPVGDIPLYCGAAAEKQQVLPRRTLKGTIPLNIYCFAGRNLWKVVVVVTQQMRVEDTSYRSFLLRLRSVCPIPEDYDILRSRIAGLPGVDLSDPKFITAHIIVARHDVRSKLVLYGMRDWAQRHRAPLFLFEAEDKFSKGKIPEIPGMANLIARPHHKDLLDVCHWQLE